MHTHVHVQNSEDIKKGVINIEKENSSSHSSDDNQSNYIDGKNDNFSNII